MDTLLMSHKIIARYEAFRSRTVGDVTFVWLVMFKHVLSVLISCQIYEGRGRYVNALEIRGAF